MKLARYGAAGAEKPALLDADGQLRDLSAEVADIDGAALSDGTLARLAALDPATLPQVDGDPRLGCPVADPRKIICIGLNYSDHAAEAGLPVPAEPIIFLKGCRASGPNDDIRLPKGSVKGDWEVELGIVIAKGGLYIAETDAMAHIAGFTVVNDVSERSYQMERSGQWTKGKSFPGFAPIGPWIVTPDEAGDPGDLGIWLKVNDTVFQNGSTSTLIFSVPHIVHYVSQFFALEPGDVIATGTPPGVGMGIKPDPVYLKPGDEITLGIDGLGTQRQRVLAWEG
ncbi:MAG: fumarylacetoacetate hydrolase family protein [Pseudomonadota bacterium]